MLLLVALVLHFATGREPVTELAAGRTPRVTVPRPFEGLRDSTVPRLEPLVIRRAPWTGADLPKKAVLGVPMAVNITAYCLRGRTRSGELTREGIIAADPRVFPLGSQVDVFLRGRHLGRFRVLDSGRHIKGPRLDVWMRKCGEAITFGRRNGTAVLVPPDSAPVPTSP